MSNRRQRCIGCVNFHADAEPDLELPEEEDYDSGIDDGEVLLNLLSFLHLFFPSRNIADANSLPQDVDFDTNEPLSKFRKERGPVAPVAPSLANNSIASPGRGTEDDWDAVSRASTVQSDVSQSGMSTGTSDWSYPASSYARTVASSQHPKGRDNNKGGWAKVDKLKKPNINALMTANGTTEMSEWKNVRDKPKPGQNVVDPWDLIYK